METLIQFRNRSRKILRGMIHRPAGRAGRTGVPGAVLLHGFTGDRMESHWIFVKCSRALARAGIASLRFDFSGSGESEGTFSEASLETEVADALAGIEFFRRQRGISRERIALIGLSLGGFIAATLAHRVRAQALVLWSAPASLEELRSVAEQLSMPVKGQRDLVEYNAHRISRNFLNGIGTLDPLRGIASFQKPTLLIHAEKDETVSACHARRYLDAAGAAVKEAVIVPGADHTFNSTAWEREAIERSVAWLQTYLA
ncbi:MAG: alpha/beta hydrolase [Terriglobia bacterium]